jgi:two-component system, OmpR family, KDP operon response regulator KdpE
MTGRRRYRARVPQVLVIEDDARIRTAITRALGERGHAVASAPTAMAGLRETVNQRPDLVVLDLGLPDVDGADLLAMLRAVTDVPIIIASARDDDPGIVRLLDAGADDYVVKPFTAEQLDARIRAVLRRVASSRQGGEPLTVGELVIDVGARTATIEGRALDLSPKEFDLLVHLAGREGQVVTKKELLTEVWRLPHGGSDKTVDVHLSWLRRKLGESAEQPRYIHTVRGVGVKLIAPPPA